MTDRNPLLEPWSTPHGVPPFAAIEPAHFAPAFAQAMREHLDEVEAIASQPDAPSFDNTVARFDAAGRGFSRIDLVFHNLCASHAPPELRAHEARAAAQPFGRVDRPAAGRQDHPCAHAAGC